ncbi:condensation domain-containing protein, partial [Bacillus cereus]|uniref:condensation domain-containing protein n=1 Tax=Bacillus cereus TaxID=1396 RepID=UPI0011454D15
LGGHSLNATVLKSKLHKALNKDIALKELFRLPTIKELSTFLENEEENIYEKIEKIEKKEYYEASSAQKRMYMLQGLDKESVAYNILGGLEIFGNLDISKLNVVLMQLIKRHET